MQERYIIAVCNHMGYVIEELVFDSDEERMAVESTQYIYGNAEEVLREDGGTDYIDYCTMMEDEQA